MTDADRQLPIDPDDRQREQQRLRARRHRRRERENLQNVNLDVPCVTINRLIDDGYLALEHAGDRRAVGRAIEKLLADYNCGSLMTIKR